LVAANCTIAGVNPYAFGDPHRTDFEELLEKSGFMIANSPCDAPEKVTSLQNAPAIACADQLPPVRRWKQPPVQHPLHPSIDIFDQVKQEDRHITVIPDDVNPYAFGDPHRTDFEELLEKSRHT